MISTSNLSDFYVQKGRLSENEARFYAAEVIDALEYIHNLGVIHRDIKVVPWHGYTASLPYMAM